MTREHPSSDDLTRVNDGPAAIIFNDGTAIYAKEFVYTTAIKFTGEYGMPQTVKSDAIKRIVYVEDKNEYEEVINGNKAQTDEVLI